MIIQRNKSKKLVVREKEVPQPILGGAGYPDWSSGQIMTIEPNEVSS